MQVFWNVTPLEIIKRKAEVMLVGMLSCVGNTVTAN
jgi:hypothetical protein